MPMPGLKAVRHAAARLAYLEAIAHLERGLGLLHSLSESPARDGSEVELQLALGLSLFSAKGAVEAKPAYMRALEFPVSIGEIRCERPFSATPRRATRATFSPSRVRPYNALYRCGKAEAPRSKTRGSLNSSKGVNILASRFDRGGSDELAASSAVDTDQQEPFQH